MRQLCSLAPLICDSPLWLVGDAQTLLFLGSSVHLAGRQGRLLRVADNSETRRAEQPRLASRPRGAAWVVAGELEASEQSQREWQIRNLSAGQELPCCAWALAQSSLRYLRRMGQTQRHCPPCSRKQPALGKHAGALGGLG